MQKTVSQQLKEMVDIQTTNGNWNYDPYMHGMANGLILAQSIVDGTEPKFLEAPETWLADAPVIKSTGDL